MTIDNVDIKYISLIHITVITLTNKKLNTSNSKEHFETKRTNQKHMYPALNWHDACKVILISPYTPTRKPDSFVILNLVHL